MLKKRLNTLNIRKNSEMEHKMLIPGQKELLNLFDNLSDIILTDKTLMSLKDKNEKLKEESKKLNVNENEENENENEKLKEKANENENDLIKILIHSIDYDEETMDQSKKDKIIKRRLAHLSNKIDKNLLEQIFDHKFETLGNKLINATNKKENQIIVNNIKKNKDKLYEKDEFNDWVIQSQQRGDLKYTIDLILDFNEEVN